MANPLLQEYLDKRKQERLKKNLGYPSVSQYLSTQKALLAKQALYQSAIAWGDDLVVTEDETKYHSWLIGTTQFGKSKFFELCIRKNILDGLGCLVVDPAGTLHASILRFCASIGHRKVISIDPHPNLPYYAILDPLKLEPGESVNARAGLVADAIATAFDEKSADTPSLTKFMTAILELLCRARRSILDAEYFLYRDDPRKSRIMEEASKSWQAVRVLQDFYENSSKNSKDLLSTDNRLRGIFQNHGLRTLLAPGDALCFSELVRDNYVILVNCNPDLWAGRGHEPKVLASFILNSVLVCKPQKRYPIYVDEVGYFATSKLKEILSLKLKEKFVLYLAHQWLDQLRDAKIYKAVANSCQCKIVFNISDPDDAPYIAKQLWGQSAGAEQAQILQNLNKQQAVIKVPGQEVKVRQIPTVPDIPEQNLDTYFHTLYGASKHYRSRFQAVEDLRHPTKPKPSEPSEAPQFPWYK